MKDLILRLKRFLTTEIWRIKEQELPFFYSYALRCAKIFLITMRKFWEEKVYLRASALTFYALLSIVPIFAMAFGIAKGFGFEKILEREIKNRLFGVVSPEVINKIITSANNLLMSTKGGMIAGIGLVALFWTIIRVIGNIELAFNEIWGIKKQRSFGRKFSDYLSAMLICPVLLIVSSSITVFIKTQLAHIMAKFALLGYFSPMIFFSLKFFPLFVLWGLFTFLYMFIPNTKVKLSAGLFAGIIAGTIYQLAQWAYLTFQIGVARYNAIYGSLAALPLFLMWLQISWIIVLLGAEFSYAYQNIDLFELEPDVKKMTPYGHALIAIAAMKEIAKNFCEGKSPLTESEICKLLKIPRSVAVKILDLLLKSRLIRAVNREEKDQEPAFHPAFDPHSLSLYQAIELLAGVIEDIPFGDKTKIKSASKPIQEFARLIKSSSQNRLIIELE
jgi:membrane protein